MSKITRKKKIKEVIIAISFRDFFFSCVDYNGFTYRTDVKKIPTILKAFTKTLEIMENSKNFVTEFITNERMKHRHPVEDEAKERLKKIYTKGLKNVGLDDVLIAKLLEQSVGQGETYQCELIGTHQYRMFYLFEDREDDKFQLLLIRPLLLDLNHMIYPPKNKNFDHVQNFCLACLKPNCK